MRRWGYLILIILFIWAKPSYSDDKVISLTLHKALFVEGPENNQPSGLTIWDGNLYAVSDRHDSTIFKVELKHDVALMKPYLDINMPGQWFKKKYDFEGITCDEEGNFYLISEALFKILRVTPDGKQAAWITPNLKPWGKEKGLFRVGNAFFEGITMTAPGKFILCAERQPRGFMEVDTTTNPIGVKAYQSGKTKFEFNGRNPDFTGLFWEESGLYVLERNAYLICKMVKKNNGFEEAFGWSYEHIVKMAGYKYRDMRYGKAEGLCMDKNYIYVILDNNADSRLAKPKDKRPLLLILCLG